MGEFHTHVAQPAESDDADLLPLCDAPVAQGRIRRNTRAQERSGPGQVEVGRDAQDEAIVHDDAV